MAYSTSHFSELFQVCNAGTTLGLHMAQTGFAQQGFSSTSTSLGSTIRMEEGFGGFHSLWNVSHRTPGINPATPTTPDRHQQCCQLTRAPVFNTVQSNACG